MLPTKKKKKKGQSVNYFENLGVECHFPKIGYNESSFPKRKGFQCNLPKKKKRRSSDTYMRGAAQKNSWGSEENNCESYRTIEYTI